MKTYLAVAAALAAVPLSGAATGQLNIEAANRLPFARASQTIEIAARDLAPLGATDLALIHIRDAGGTEILAQAVDTDFDDFHKPDIVIFQSDFGPGETRRFTASVGAKQVYAREQYKAFGRFVRERFDDFAWENDRIAHRMYGKALETWKGEPLTSSAVDIWSKRTPRMVINDWYLSDDYHADHGEGADFYSAGTTRGDGGNGLWAGEKPWVSKNFVQSRVLANGPIRVVFELDYEPFDVNGTPVAETKRISLDAGQNLDRYVSTYRPARAMPLVSAIGLKKVSGAQKEYQAARGTLTILENVEKNQGQQGLALVVDPAQVEREAQDNANNFLLVRAGPDNRVSYWAGFYWDRSGQFPNYGAFKLYVDQFAQGLASPIEVRVTP